MQVLKHGLEKLLECLEANACLSTFQVAGVPASAAVSFPSSFHSSAFGNFVDKVLNVLNYKRCLILCRKAVESSC